MVAPYVGAWIETYSPWLLNPIHMSHPTWVRGLKHLLTRRFERSKVAPYVGAWIETRSKSLQKSLKKSHPTWVRGLKLPCIANCHIARMSHPTWVRGLKPDTYQ